MGVEEGAAEATDDGSLTDLASAFPGMRVRRSPFGQGSGRTAMGETPGDEVGGQAHSEVFVLIDNGDGRAEAMARRLRAAGIKRFVILAGGEEALSREGRPGIMKK